MAALQVTSYAATLLAAALTFELAALPVSRAVGDGIYFLLLVIALVTGGLAVGDTVVPLVVCLVVTGLSWFVYWLKAKALRFRNKRLDLSKTAEIARVHATNKLSGVAGVGLLFLSRERSFMTRFYPVFLQAEKKETPLRFFPDDEE